jgi:hypothetical protein
MSAKAESDCPTTKPRPASEYVAWIETAAATPSAVHVPAYREYNVAFFITTTKSGPGLIAASRRINPIKRNEVIVHPSGVW